MKLIIMLVYIRYSAQKSFDASLEAVHGLLSGEMDETQAFDTFRSVMNRKDPEEKATVNFENEYSISLNDRNGRDAAASILTTIREENEAQLLWYHIIISLLLCTKENALIAGLA